MTLEMTDARVIAALNRVRRSHFLPEEGRSQAAEDHPIEIGMGQTTSQPTLIGLTIQLLQLPENARVLEIGTGSGYQTALLAEIAAEVYSVEILAPLAINAERALRDLGYSHVHIQTGDGYLGWPEAAPFDGIIVSAGAPRLPLPLVEQLKPGARMIIPIDEPGNTMLQIVTSLGGGRYAMEPALAVRFVPLTGPRAQADRQQTQN